VEAGVLIDTDVLAAYLAGTDAGAVRRALGSVACYTTVVNAAELRAAAVNEIEIAAVEQLLVGFRVLGLSARYYATIGRILGTYRSAGLTERDAIIAGTAVEAKLPLVTADHAARYRMIEGLDVRTPDTI
jgi:predicted nucleic acid-binding protein